MSEARVGATTPQASGQSSVKTASQRITSTDATVAVHDDTSVDDWGIDELSDLEEDADTLSTRQNVPANESFGSTSKSGAQQERIRGASVQSVGSSKNTSHRDIITLRAFDENVDHQAKLVSSDLTRMNMIGLYADPAAEEVDWGDDFDLEQSSSKFDASSESPAADDAPSGFPSWYIEKDPKKNEFEFKVEMSQAPSPISPMRHQYQLTTAEILSDGDDSLGLRSVPPTAFATPSLSHSSLLSYPGVGYQTSTVHPSCTRVKELFSRYDATIRRHFDALVRDSGGTSALERKTRSIYHMSSDRDLNRLSNLNKDLAADVLIWKLEWATQQKNSVDHSKILLSLSNICKHAGNYKEATQLVREAVMVAADIEDTGVSLVIRTELEYELAVLSRARGALGDSEKAAKRAMAHTTALVLIPEETKSLTGPQQRALWWQLKCKFLLAELSYDRANLDDAVQFFSEYVVEGITRMIGLIAPPRSEDTTLGTEFMRYCLFSPRRLVLAMWTILLCLGDMKCFAAAADTAALTSLVASSFGYEDANKAGSDIRLRIKEMAVELREQYDGISSAILQSSNPAVGHPNNLPGTNRIPGSQFDYGLGEFGDMADEVVEDWDTQLEKELNIKIERCWEIDQSNETSSRGAEAEGNGAPLSPTLERFGSSLPDRTGSSLKKGVGASGDANKEGRRGQAVSGWNTGLNFGNLIEAELRQYLSRVNGAASTLSRQQMYPKPTQSFDGRLMGPREHETFLRRFVRSKDPVLSTRIQIGLPVTSMWYPSAVCRLNAAVELGETAALLSNKPALSPVYGLEILTLVWKIVRGHISAREKQIQLRQLLLHSFSRISSLSKKSPAHDEGERRRRLDMLACLLDSLRLAREAISESGSDATWFSHASVFLGLAAATVTPAAKAAVELLQAESRAHCGLKTVVPGFWFDRCASAEEERLKQHHQDLQGEIVPDSEIVETNGRIPPALRQSVVDIMHALYWRTKAGFDESSDTDSFERLIHADVASGLFLTGCGLSPVDGSSIDISDETELLHISDRKNSKSVDTNTLVDETRRVSASELFQELQSLWLSLPSSAGLVRAKVSFALAQHSRIEQGDYGRAERFLFDGLQSIHAVALSQTYPHSFYSRLLFVSPVAIVSSPLAEALLHSYGTLALSHSKYRYGIAALEASTDSKKVRTKNKRSYTSAVMRVIEIAGENSDWRRAFVLLYSLRNITHPKNGQRNEFLQLCLKLHSACLDVGCIDASIVPLRAYSALIYEERLRLLLQRYRRRLAKKARNRIRRRLPGPPLPKLLPGGSVFPRGKNSLASFFEVPVVNSIDNTIRQSTSMFEMRPRSSTVMVPLPSGGRSQGVFKKLLTGLWGSSGNARRSLPPQGETTVKVNQRSDAALVPEDDSKSSRRLPSKISSKGHKAVVSTSIQADKGQFEEEQRELLRIEAEQEIAADSNRFQVELLRARTEFAKADFNKAQSRCRGLLEMRIPHASRFKVLEILARIRLMRREITRCLEFVDQMEHEYALAKAFRDFPEDSQPGPIRENQRVSKFRIHDQSHETKKVDTSSVFCPLATFLRLSALIHGGRLSEALYLADKSVEACEEHSFWDLGRLHYLRGKALGAMSSNATAPLQRENELEKGPVESQKLVLQVTELTLIAFETASRYFDASGDEVSTAKADLLWARTSIDFLFRKVVLKDVCGGGISLETACTILNRRIVVEEIVDVVYSVINLASTANIPVLLIDSMAALAEVKCIQKQSSSAWMLWVSEAWKLFSRLFTDAENFTVVLEELAPVSTLFHLRNVCGRLVRLTMCESHHGKIADMNKHLRLFEAYVTLQIAIDRKMNLSSSAHKIGSDPASSVDEVNELDAEDRDQPRPSVVSSSPSMPPGRPDKKIGIRTASLLRLKLSRDHQALERKRGSSTKDVVSDSLSETDSHKSGHRRPAGAFLHILGDEGVALGRQGLSVFINRPRQQVISAVKGTGAVLIPSNFFSNSKAAPGHELGRDAEMIFPFKPHLGLGAMQILDDSKGKIDERIELNDSELPDPDPASEPEENGDRGASSEGADMNITQSQDATEANAREDLKDVGKRQDGPVDTDPRQSTKGPLPDEKRDESFVPPPRISPRERNRSTKKVRRHELAELLSCIQDELESGRTQTNGSSPIFGHSTAERVWSHMHRINTETSSYMHGEINLEQLRERNNDALLSWVHCIPVSRKEWTIPESIGRRLVYILYAHGVVGYYAVDRGGSIESVAFGGKQGFDEMVNGIQTLRSPTKAERMYLSDLVKGYKRDEVWHKNRDSEIVNGLANRVLRAPRSLLSSSSPAQKSRSRPIVLIADLTLQILPWELFFDHVVIRSHCLLDMIRGLQDGAASQSHSSLGSIEDPVIAASRKIARFISFGPSRREVIDLERTEEARRQQLAFQGLLRLNHMNPANIIAFLGLGGFSDPTAVNAVPRPTGPLSSPLSQSRKAVRLFGLRISANIGKRNYPHMDFLKVPGLGSATTGDLKEAAMVLQPMSNDKDEPKRDLGAYVPVFMFSYADLVDSSDSVFGLRKLVPSAILMFTPAIHMKVLARHLEDDELSVELRRASGRLHNRIFPDVIASARILVEYVSRFSREKRIPIVVFLGKGLVGVFPRKRGVKGNHGRQTTPAAERLVQIHGAGRVFPGQ